MKRVRLGSAAIASVGYDENERTLDVEFRDGDIYRYVHIPKFVYRELLKAESAGAFWNQVKDNYKFTRVDAKGRKR
jgi:KTSC domain-containing protein